MLLSWILIVLEAGSLSSCYWRYLPDTMVDFLRCFVWLTVCLLALLDDKFMEDSALGANWNFGTESSLSSIPPCLLFKSKLLRLPRVLSPSDASKF